MMTHKIYISIAFILSIFSLNNIQANESIEEYPVVILGSGVAALTSATYLARSGVQPLVITGNSIGGALNLTVSIQNWPGEMEITGKSLSDKLYDQAEENGAVMNFSFVKAVDFSKTPFEITLQDTWMGGDDKTIKAHACIIALGSFIKILQVPGEFSYWGKGVSTCAVCDGSFYKNKIVAVVGGGDSALTEAKYLSNIAKKIYLIVRSDHFRSIDEKKKNEVLNLPNIEVLYETTIEKIEGDEHKLTHLVIKKDELEKTLFIDALFLGIGSLPNSYLFQDQLELDEKGYITLVDTQQTSIPGVFAAGDVADFRFRQAATAAGDGVKAALQAHDFLISSVPSDILRKETKKAEKGTPIVQEVFSIEEVENSLEEADLTVLYFTATYCGPCSFFTKIYENLALNFMNKKVQFLKVTVDQHLEFLDKYEIEGFPSVAVFNKEKEMVLKGFGFELLPEIKRLIESLESAQ